MEILNLKKVEKGKLRAFFDLETPKLTIYGCKLLEGQDGNLWAAMPTREFQHNGEKKWAPIIKITDEGLLDKISQLARETYHGGEQTEEVPF